MRFVGDGPLLSGVTLEMSLEIIVVPGPPASWGVSLVETSAGANGGGPGTVTSQVTENLGFVACGAVLSLEIEAHDAHGNRWVWMFGEYPRESLLLRRLSVHVQGIYMYTGVHQWPFPTSKCLHVSGVFGPHVFCWQDCISLAH